MGSRDLVGDLCQRGVVHPAIFEAILVYRHGMGSIMPFADESGARLQTEAWRRTNTACGVQALRKRLQLAKCRLAKSAVLDFLAAISNTEN